MFRSQVTRERPQAGSGQTLVTSLNAIKRVTERAPLLNYSRQITRAQVRVSKLDTLWQLPFSRTDQQHRRAGRLAHQPLNFIENQPYPSDHRDHTHAEIESSEWVGAHQCELCPDRVAPFGLCVRRPKLISAWRTSSRSLWSSRCRFAMPATERSSARFICVNLGLFTTTSALKCRSIKDVLVKITSNGLCRNV